MNDGKRRPAPGQVSESVWQEAVCDHAREMYPEECCGVLTLLAGGEGATPELEVHRCQNIQAELHEKDPERYPSSARTGYYVDPGDYLRVARSAADAGAAIVAIYHSHIDAGAYFSDSDRRQAAPDGEPLLADVAYLVVSVIGGQVREKMLYAWDAELSEYVDVALEALLPAPAGR